MKSVTVPKRVRKDMTLKDGSPGAEGIQYATGEEWRRTTSSHRKLKQLGQGRNNVQLQMCLVMKEKPNASKNSVAQEPGILGP